MRRNFPAIVYRHSFARLLSVGILSRSVAQAPNVPRSSSVMSSHIGPSASGPHTQAASDNAVTSIPRRTTDNARSWTTSAGRVRVRGRGPFVLIPVRADPRLVCHADQIEHVDRGPRNRDGDFDPLADIASQQQRPLHDVRDRPRVVRVVEGPFRPEAGFPAVRRDRRVVLDEPIRRRKRRRRRQIPRLVRDFVFEFVVRGPIVTSPTISRASVTRG